MASSNASFPTMTTSRDAPNPLRPYYVRPSVGITPGQPTNTSAAASSGAKAGIGRSAKDLLSELDYGGPLLDRDGPTVGEIGKKIFDQAIWKYTSVLLAQPFDVAKTILQIRLAAVSEGQMDTKVRSGQSTSSDVDRRRADVGALVAWLCVSTLLHMSSLHSRKPSQRMTSRLTSHRRDRSAVGRATMTGHHHKDADEDSRHPHHDHIPRLLSHLLLPRATTATVSTSASPTP